MQELSKTKGDRHRLPSISSEHSTDVNQRSSVIVYGLHVRHVRSSLVPAFTVRSPLLFAGHDAWNSLASDAIPKKRGPKTDILESLLKRVDGLEKRLKTEASSDTSAPDSAPVPSSDIQAEVAAAAEQVRKASSASKEPQSAVSQSSLSPVYPRSALSAQAPESALIIDSPTSPNIFPDVLLDTYFSRIHGKPYYILDEPSTRQRAASNQLPSHLAFSIYAISARSVRPLWYGNRILIES